MGLLEALVTLALAALGFFLGGHLTGKAKGKQEAATEQLQADVSSAQETRKQVDAAHARNRSDPRPVDERLRDKGRLRD